MGWPIIGDAQWDDTSALAYASETASGYHARNLLLNGYTKTWASLDATGIKTLRFESSSTRVVSLVGIHGHNGTKYGTFRTRFANSVAGLIAPVYDTAPFGPSVLSVQGVAENDGTASGLTATDFTVEFWFYPFHPQGHGLAKRAGGTDAPTLSVSPDGLVLFRDEPNQVTTLTSAASIVEREWIHVAGTLSGTTAHLILHDSEGTLIQDVTSTVSGWDTGTQLMIGPTLGTFDGFSGYMNEIRFWDVARTEAQINGSLFSKYTGTESVNLLGVWGGEAPTSGSLTNRVAAGPALVLANPYYAYGGSQRTGLWPTQDRDDEEWHDAFLHVPEGINCKVVQIEYLDNLQTEERHRVSRVVLSEAVQFPRYPSVDGTMFASFTDYSQSERNILGQESGYRLQPQREFVVKIGSDEAWAWNQIARIYNRAGSLGDVTAIMNPDALTVDEMNVGLRRFPSSFQIPYRTWQWREATLNLRAA